MKKYLALCLSTLFIYGFTSLSGNLNEFKIENKTTLDWETESSGTSVKAYNKQYDLELVFNVSPFMPSSALCTSNKRIKDIKFDINIYKKMQKGDAKFGKMVERMRINFSSPGFSEEKRIYGSDLVKDSVTFEVGQTVQIGTLYFLAPLTCKKIDQMKMRITNITIQGRPVPPLEILFELKE